MKKETLKKPSPKWLIPAIIVGFVFLIFGNSIKNEYALDDDIVTSTYDHQNIRIEKGIRGIPELFRSRHYQSPLQNYAYRPLVLTTFAIEYQFFKQNPHLSHFINLLLYALTCLLLFSILALLFSSYHFIFPMLATLLFAAHPLHTEVVDSLKNRDELMSFLFGLLSLRFSLKYIDNKKVLTLIASAFFLLLAFLSKKTAIVFLPLIPLTIYFFKKIEISKIILPFVMFIAVFGLFIIFKKLLLHDFPVKRVFVFTENPLFYEHHLLKRIPAGLYILWHYLKQMVIPFPLSSYYGFDTIPMANWSNPFVWISLGIHLSITIFALKNLPEKKILAFGILFYIVAIFPYSNLFRPGVGIVADRFAYASSLGFCIVTALLLLKLKYVTFRKNQVAGKSSFLFVSIAAGVCISFSVLTFSRNSDWKDVLTLFRTDVKKFDNSYNLHYMIVNSLTPQIFKLPDSPKRKQLIDEALIHYNRMAEIVESGIEKYPLDYTSRNNLGVIYVKFLEVPEKAQILFEQAISTKPDYTEAYFNLGYSYEKRNLPDSAIKYYEKTLELDNYHSPAFSQLFGYYLKNMNFKAAIQLEKKAIRSFPDHAEYFVNLGNVYLLEKDTLNGIKCFETALELEPYNNNLHSQIIFFFKTSGFTEKARVLEEKWLHGLKQ